MAIWSKKSDGGGPGDQGAAATSHVPGTMPAGAAAAPPGELSSEARSNAAAVSKAVMATFGQIATVLMRTPEYKGYTLGDLEWLAVPAVMTGQFSLAEAQSKATGMMAPVGLVLWANVSAEIDRRIRENPAAPIRLKPEEWKSGDILWVVDAIGDPKILQAMLEQTSAREWKGRAANIRMRAQDGSMRIGQLTQRPPSTAA